MSTIMLAIFRIHPTLIRFLFSIALSLLAQSVSASVLLFEPTCEWFLTAQALDLTEKIQVPSQITTPDQNLFLAGVNRIRERLLEINSNPVDTVFYPMAGFDAFTPMTLFPETKRIVALDDHSFLSESNKNLTWNASPFFGKFYESAANVDRTPQLSAAIVGALLGADPKIRILSVIEFKTKGLGRETASNGWIQYDTGEGTLKREYIHIQGRVEWHKPAHLQPWFHFLEHTRINAVIVKGAMLTFSYLSQGGVPYSGRVFFRDAIERWLTNSNGVLVSGSSGFEHDKPEFLTGLSNNQISAPTVVSNVDFGYGNQALIFTYK